MKEIHQTNWQLILKWLEDACRILNKQGTPYKQNDGGDIDKIYKAISALYKIKKPTLLRIFQNLIIIK